MKTPLRIGLFFFIGIIIVFILYFIIRENLRTRKQDQMETPDAIQQEQSVQDVRVADTEQRIDKETVITIIEYNDITEEEKIYDQDLNVQLIGFNREELSTFYKLYLLSPNEYDVKHNLIDIEVSTFSEKRIIIRKTYHKEIIQEGYYALAPEGYLIIFYPDLYTIYIETNLELKSFPLYLQEEIKNGKHFKTLDEVYNFLESYTS